ncbi:hypothetical protein KFE96_13515 [Kordiimonas sp. SCSIO 12603]|uniref:DUF6916 family protein n=1 Tax=Kordiimonas sp. SCSIO 12603 TaxID=2829596 RepID=UPI0021033CF1|nr:hypothetical protein [Kordiimonas sp. SCSIO 12603]UTW57842.1 hypothetical protein KFE96_13515 [Kordiimonas sp. SCSIO 12603]
MLNRETKHVDIATLSANVFSSHIGKVFELQLEELALPVTLMECKENPDGAGPDSVRTPFNLVFQADEADNHPLLQAKEFKANICGLMDGIVGNVWINRTLRPVKMPKGAYFQVVFS